MFCFPGMEILQPVKKVIPGRYETTITSGNHVRPGDRLEFRNSRSSLLTHLTIRRIVTPYFIVLRNGLNHGKT